MANTSRPKKCYSTGGAGVEKEGLTGVPDLCLYVGDHQFYRQEQTSKTSALEESGTAPRLRSIQRQRVIINYLGR